MIRGYLNLPDKVHNGNPDAIYNFEGKLIKTIKARKRETSSYDHELGSTKVYIGCGAYRYLNLRGCE